MRVTVVGCAGSFPGPDSPASCYLLEAEGFRLVIDLGNGALGVLQRYAGLFDIDAICVSHLHADHCADLGTYWVVRQYPDDGPKPPIPVHGPRGTADRVAGLGSAAVPAVQARGFRLVIDLGNGALGVLQRYAGLFDIDAICVSHLHADHCADLGTYWVVRQYPDDGPKPPIPVHGPRGTADRVAGLGSAAVPAVQARFTFHELEPGSFGIGPFRLTAERMSHPVETFGFRVEHAGWRLAYSADTGESEALVRLAAGADALLCEASFLDGQDTRPDLHLTARQAAAHAARAGVGQLVLTHLVPWNDRDRTLAEADGIYTGPLSLATSGLVLGPAAPPPAGR